MDIIITLRNRLECKINYTLPALLPNNLNITKQGPVTSGENVRSKRAIPALAIIQGVAAIGEMMIKGINALVDAKRASSFNNAIKLVNENVQITHDRLITLENPMQNKDIPNIQQHNMSLFNRSFMCRSLIDYAKLPVSLRAENRILTFERSLKKTSTICINMRFLGTTITVPELKFKIYIYWHYITVKFTGTSLFIQIYLSQKQKYCNSGSSA